MAFSDEDKNFMRVALNKAKEALNEGNYPVGAALVIDGKLIDTMGNSLNTGKDWASHAEANLIRKCSPTIKESIKSNGSEVVLYSTLEPCLMCLGSSILHRISRVVFACHDPHGGATNLDVKSLPRFYNKRWPLIESGLFRDESYDLMIRFLENQTDESWKKMLNLFRDMHEKW